MVTETPYGEWRSPISAAALTTTARRLGFPTIVENQIWWSEDRPQQGGRTTVMACRPGGEPVELLPAPWSVRSRVHEYGGRSFLALPGPAGPVLIFIHARDQRLYRLDPGTPEPVPVSPEPAEPGALRYADLVPGPGGAVLCVREHHIDAPARLERHLVAMPVDGSAATDPARVREVAGGSRFLANPRLSPSGDRLAWLAWDHPRMPWDGTELRVGQLDATGTVRDWHPVLGGPRESVFQPEWAGPEHLVAASDRTGWWNLYRVTASGTGEVEALCPAEEEFGAPLWQLGSTTWGWLADGRIACLHGVGDLRLGVLDPRTGELADLDLPYRGFGSSVATAGDQVAAIGYSPSSPSTVVTVTVPPPGREPAAEDPDRVAAPHTPIRASVDPAALPGPAYLPVPESTGLTAADGTTVYAHIYPPRNPDHTGPTGDRPPYVIFIHGGPTGSSPATLDLTKAYFTSRGIGVLDLEYGGSTGYGRTYRERLNGQWGVVDVADAVAAAAALVARGDADPARIAIRGGSAGGWTALCAVTGTDVFAAATSRYGVADLARLAETTHDFESRYLETLVGAETLARDTRSPLHNAAKVRCPVLLLQGSDDPVVPLEQAERFRDALAANRVPHALAVFDGEQHGFRTAASIERAAEAELSFYGQVLGFTPPGVPKLPLSG